MALRANVVEEEDVAALGAVVRGVGEHDWLCSVCGDRMGAACLGWVLARFRPCEPAHDGPERNVTVAAVCNGCAPSLFVLAAVLDRGAPSMR